MNESAAAINLPALPSKVRVAMAAWEIGRTQSGLGTKIGGLGVVVEELPPELVRVAARRQIGMEVVTLSPCFAHYDKSKLTKLDIRLPVRIDNYSFDVQAYEYNFTETVRFPGGSREVIFKSVYFWDEGQLRWTSARAIYPDDPQVAWRMHAVMAQAMAGYIKQCNFQVVHLHDYHVGLVPLYLGTEYLNRTAVHLTIHNATYQGFVPIVGSGPASLERINLAGEKLYPYFDHFGKLCIMKAAMLKVHESDGQVTTVSGNLEATWGYAAELRESNFQIMAKAWGQKGSQPGEVFVSNRGLDLFEKLPILGITNGMSDNNRPENLPELKASVLRDMQSKRQQPLFWNQTTQREMLEKDHNFDANRLEIKQQLRRLLYLEAFHHEPFGFPIIFTAVGRLVEQKNFGLIAEIIPRVLNHDNQSKFIILASAHDGDPQGKALERHFQHLSNVYSGRVCFNNTFNQALSKLILAGGDFTLIPSRFEPCGLVDYEAALLGTIPIARATGGLTKIRHCGYLYEWLDVRDHGGEAHAFFTKIQEAMGVYRQNYGQHQDLIRKAMATDASWDASAGQYLDLYRYGLLVKQWREARRGFLNAFAHSLGSDRPTFTRFFAPKFGPNGDEYDWQLKNVLHGDGFEPQRAYVPQT